MPFTAQQQPFSTPSIPCISPKAQVGFPHTQPSLSHPQRPAGPYAGGPRLETPGSRDRCSPTPPAPGQQRSALKLPLAVSHPGTREEGPKPWGIQGAGLGTIPLTTLAAGEGLGDRKPEPFRPCGCRGFRLPQARLW